MGTLKLKSTPMRVLRAFRWQRAFERLMQEREQMLSLKEMATLITDIGRIESDVFRAVTEEELKALEDDPMHGMSDVAMMYVYFMRATSTIYRSTRNLGDYNDDDWKHITEILGAHKSDDFRHKMEVFKQHDEGRALLTSVNIGFVDNDGVKRWVSLSAAAIDDVGAKELVAMMRQSMLNLIWKKGRKRNAYQKRRNLFRDLALDRIEEGELRRKALGKSEDDPE